MIDTRYFNRTEPTLPEWADGMLPRRFAWYQAGGQIDPERFEPIEDEM